MLTIAHTLPVHHITSCVTRTWLYTLLLYYSVQYFICYLEHSLYVALYSTPEIQANISKLSFSHKYKNGTWPLWWSVCFTGQSMLWRFTVHTLRQRRIHRGSRCRHGLHCLKMVSSWFEKWKSARSSCRIITVTHSPHINTPSANTTASVNTMATRINFLSRHHSGKLGQEGCTHLRVREGAQSDSSAIKYWPPLKRIHVWFSVQGRQVNLGWGLKQRLQILISDRVVNKVGAENRVIYNKEGRHLSSHYLHLPGCSSGLWTSEMDAVVVAGRWAVCPRVCVCVWCEFVCIYVLELTRRGPVSQRRALPETTVRDKANPATRLLTVSWGSSSEEREAKRGLQSCFRSATD